MLKKADCYAVEFLEDTDLGCRIMTTKERNCHTGEVEWRAYVQKYSVEWTPILPAFQVRQLASLSYEDFMDVVLGCLEEVCEDLDAGHEEARKGLAEGLAAVTYDQAARFMECSASYLYRLIREGRLHAQSINGRNMLDSRELVKLRWKKRKNGAFVCRKHGQIADGCECQDCCDEVSEFQRRCLEERMDEIAEMHASMAAEDWRDANKTQTRRTSLC